jgi:hypothetical protein
MSLAALGLVIGLVLVHNGRKIRLEKDFGDWVLGFVDVETGLDYVLATDLCDQPIRTTIDWLFTEKDAGRLVDPSETSDTDGRRRMFLGLDRAACIRRDKKSAWRFRWAWAVLQDPPATTSDDSYRLWIAGREDLIPDDTGNCEPTPEPSSLRRWVRKLKAAKGRRGALVSCAGRLKGQSSLPGFEDWLVQEAAIYFWAAEDAKVIDGGGYYIEMRDRITESDDEELKKRLAANPVRLETIRRRVRMLEGAATTQAKEGARRSRRMFQSAGEGVPVERFLERVEMDGLELRQIVNYSDDWPVPAGKMKLINAIDSRTHFWFWPALFCGPYREDMTAIALMNVMMPPQHLSAEHFEKWPWLAEAWGTMDLVAPDNEKAIFSPGSVSALTELGPDLEMPDANHPDSKPLVEALNRFIKGFLEHLPGTVRGPRHPKDPTRNAVDEAEMTRAQLRTQLLVAWLYWNTTERDYLGGRSPLDMVRESIEADDRPKRNAPGDVRRGLYKTHDQVTITRDGFEFDGIIYQAPELGAVLDANYHRTGFKDRVDGTAKIIASIRTNEGNLHEAEVYDEERHRCVPVFSTEPGYTWCLSRWEHGEYKQMVAAQKPRRQSELEKMRARKHRVQQAAKDMPRASIRVASRAAALIAHDEVRRASGIRANAPEFMQPSLYGILARSGRDQRTDVPKSVHVPAPPGRKKRPDVPESMMKALGGEVAPPDADQASKSDDFSWPSPAFADDDDALDLDELDEES